MLVNIVFFFKQKTAYEVLRSLVGSEMCIRDSMQAAYGLTSKQATTFLADASNAFVAMGATRERALEMAQSVVQLTAAISAYSGKPMVDVSKALDLALLGNTRNLRNYGLAIRQSAVNDELAARGKDKLTGSALQLATSEVALKLILEAAQVPVSYTHLTLPTIYSV